jgi:hypothetical protein
MYRVFHAAYNRKFSVAVQGACSRRSGIFLSTLPGGQARHFSPAHRPLLILSKIIFVIADFSRAKRQPESAF